jgi:ASCH domain
MRLCGAWKMWHKLHLIPRSNLHMKIRKSPAPIVRWIPTHEKLPALSIWQPWAWLIVNGYKDVESRNWCPPPGTEDILIHAGLNNSELSEERLQEIEEEYGVRLPHEFEQGVVIGVVEVQACAIWSHSPWHHCGFKGWMLARPRRLKFREYQGQLKLFRAKFD